MEDLDHTEQHHIDYALNRASFDFVPNRRIYCSKKKTTFPSFIKQKPVSFLHNKFSSNENSAIKRYCISSRYANYSVDFDNFKTFAILNSNFAHVYLNAKNQGQSFAKRQNTSYVKQDRKHFDGTFKKTAASHCRMTKSAASLNYIRDSKPKNNNENIESSNKLSIRSQTAFPNQNGKKIRFLPPFPTSKKMKSSRTRFEDFHE